MHCHFTDGQNMNQQKDVVLHNLRYIFIIFCYIKLKTRINTTWPVVLEESLTAPSNTTGRIETEEYPDRVLR